MSGKSGKSTLMNEFKVGFHQYLKETTIHGLRYLVDGRNICEIAIWSIVIAVCFTIAFIGVYTSLRDSYDDPILTSVHTTQIQEVNLNLNNICKMQFFHILVRRLK